MGSLIRNIRKIGKLRYTRESAFEHKVPSFASSLFGVNIISLCQRHLGRKNTIAATVMDYAWRPGMSRGSICLRRQSGRGVFNRCKIAANERRPGERCQNLRLFGDASVLSLEWNLPPGTRYTPHHAEWLQVVQIKQIHREPEETSRSSKQTGTDCLVHAGIKIHTRAQRKGVPLDAKKYQFMGCV